jgi:hypothetical protein
MDYYPALGRHPLHPPKLCGYLKRDASICQKLVATADAMRCPMHRIAIPYRMCENGDNCRRVVSTKHNRVLCNACEKIANQQAVVDARLAYNAREQWRRRYRDAAMAAAAVAAERLAAQ